MAGADVRTISLHSEEMTWAESPSLVAPDPLLLTLPGFESGKDVGGNVAGANRCQQQTVAVVHRRHELWFLALAYHPSTRLVDLGHVLATGPTVDNTMPEFEVLVRIVK